MGDKTGRDWVRPISVELFGQGLDATADCGVKIHGGHSRLAEKTPKHSLRLMFKEKYGAHGKLKADLFAQPGAHKFEQITLRCMFGNTWLHWLQDQRLRAQYTRDMWMRNTQRLMGHPSARGCYVHLYLNDWSAERLTLRAITRQNTQYSATAEWTFVLDHSDASIHQLAADEPASENAIYDLWGRQITSQSSLPSGIYIVNGKKVRVNREE